MRKLKTGLAALDIEEKVIDLENLHFAMQGAVREFNRYYEIFETLPKFTYEQMQDAEERYWQLRLARQAQCDIDASGRIGTGNHEALWQAGLIENPGHEFLERNHKGMPVQIVAP